MKGHQNGYVLIMVLAALALLAAVATRLASRVEQRREASLRAEQAFEQRKQALEAWHTALYAIAVSQPGTAGWGPFKGDGRLYLLPSGAQVRFQDERGLLSVNSLDRSSWLNLLTSLGESAQSADTLIDVLSDYTDVDDLRRLNGAEASEYEALNLAAPRNDWLISTDELARMPQWRERKALRDSLQPWLSTSLLPVVNPNTAQLGLLQALYPAQPAEVWTQFELERERQAFSSTAELRLRTGLIFAEDRHSFFSGLQLNVAVWPAGAQQGLQYNLTLLPTGQLAPWLVTSVQPVALPSSAHPPRHATAFPLDIDLQPHP